MFRIFSEQPDNFGSASPPVPWDEGDVRRKLVPLHQRQKFPKVHKAMRGLQHRIINHQARVRFRSVPAGLGECPFDVKDKRHCAEEVLPDIEILRGQFRVDIDDLSGGRKKDRHAFVFELQENRAITERNDVDHIPFGRA